MQILKDDSATEVKKVLKKFEDEYSRKMNLSVLYELGFDDDDLDYNVQFNKDKSRIEGKATLLDIPLHLVPKVKDIGFKKGDEILLFTSWKPSFQELDSVLAKNYYPELHMNEETGVVIAILRKKVGIKFYIDDIEIKMVSGERGVYAKRDIKKNTRLFDYKGKLLNYRTKHTLQIDEDKHLAGPILFDHSCNANCKIDWANFDIMADREIKTGEKLTFNYLTSEEELRHPFSCYCNETNCKILIKGFKYLSASEKRELMPYLSPFLKRKYEKEMEGSDKLSLNDKKLKHQKHKT